LASEPSLALPSPFDTLLDPPIPEPFHVALRLVTSGKTSTPVRHPCLIAKGTRSFSCAYRIAVPAQGALAIGEGTGDGKVIEYEYPLHSRCKTCIILQTHDGSAIPTVMEIIMRTIGWGRNEYSVLNGVRYEWWYDGKW